MLLPHIQLVWFITAWCTVRIDRCVCELRSVSQETANTATVTTTTTTTTTTNSITISINIITTNAIQMIWRLSLRHQRRFIKRRKICYIVRYI